MALIGEYGHIESIVCSVEPQLATAEAGQARAIEPDEKFVRVNVYPDNCPRGPRFDFQQKLGCLSCGQAIIYYEGITEI